MEKQLARIVNKGLAGEPEYVVFQIKENLQCVEFSQIKFINENGTLRNVVLSNSDISQPEILHVLNEMGHECELSINDGNEVTLYF
jgi:hypothetical protein